MEKLIATEGVSVATPAGTSADCSRGTSMYGAAVEQIPNETFREGY
jgi:hypothetical protein